MSNVTIHLKLEPEDNHRLAAFCGQNDDNILQIEASMNVSIKNQGHHFSIAAEKTVQAKKTAELLTSLYELTAKKSALDPAELNLLLHQAKSEEEPTKIKATQIMTKKGLIKPRGNNQIHYLHNILSHDINFGIGPAGTGKTYLAVAAAVYALEKEQVQRVILVRPAVEAGERLGFLPGDLAQKVDPYLRPLYDALYEMLGFEKVEKLQAKNIIEIAPLAYMRGRTLNNAFIILDESQNTTKEQMKMFLTRIGFGSTAVITGDVTQIDLQRGQRSGLLHIVDVLRHIKGISFTFFKPKDVVRHPLVQTIIEAYEEYEATHHD